MKRLIYIFITTFLCIIPTKAEAKEELMYCEYKWTYINSAKTDYISYKVTYYDDNTVKHEYIPTNSLNYKQGSNTHNGVGIFNANKRAGEMRYLKDNFTATEMQKYYNKKTCPYIIYTSATGSLADRQITPSETSDTSSYSKEDYRDAVASSYSSSHFKKEETETPGTSGSAICVYDSPKNYANKFSITCQGTNNCKIDTSLDLTIASDAASLTIGDTCPEKIYITILNNKTITSINTTSGSALYLNKDKSTEGNSSSGENESNEPSNSEPYETDSRYIEAKKDVEKYCDPTNFAYQDDEKCEEAKKKMNEVKALYENTDGDFDAENFCTGPVQGVFTTLGWVFFVIKILIPILLIVFGSIDVGKAVVASKDDEIKKSIKTLALRTIAGVIIFFVPTILNFGIKLIDNSEVYNGTFLDCTKCMLDPINNVCSGLRSEE